MICAYCQTENAEADKTCPACGISIAPEPALTLAVPVGVVPVEMAPHPFAHPCRTRIVQGIKDAITALLIVPAMAGMGGVIGVLFFALVIGILDYLYFHPELSRPYLEMLAHKSLPAGLFAGIPTGAYAAIVAAGAFVRNAGKLLTAFCTVTALPFLVLPPFHLFHRVLQISSHYDLPQGIMGGCLIALPFLVFIKFYHSIFTSALASRR
jgi:hypothetical protein